MTKEEYIDKMRKLTEEYALSDDYENISVPMIVSLPLGDFKLRRVRCMVSTYLEGLTYKKEKEK